MKKENYCLFNKIGLSASISFIVSLLIGLITKNLVIRCAVLAVLLVGLFLFLFKKKKESLKPIIISAAIAAVLSVLLPNTISLVIVSAIMSFIIVEKIPSSFRALAYFILFTALLTWILPVNYYSGELVEEAKSQVGLFDLFSYPGIALSYFGNNFIYLLLIGAFYGVLYKIPAYRDLLDSLASKASKCKKVFLAVIIALISILVSVTGASVGVWIIIPFIVSLIILMGYDKLVAATVTIGSICVGLIGNTFSSTYISNGYNLSAHNGAGIVNSILQVSDKSLLLPKVILLVLGIGILTFFAIRKTYNIEKNEDNKELLPEQIKTKEKRRVWPLALIFDLTFIIVLLAFTSWTTVFKLQWFKDATTFVLAKVQFNNFPIFGKLLGNINEFEQWGVVEVSTLLIISSFIISKIYKVKFSDYCEAFVKGAKKALKPAVLVTLAYVVLVIVSYNPITLTIMKPIITATKGFNVFTASISAMIASLFNVDIYYIASASLQYVSSLFTSNNSLLALIWYSVYGFTSLVAPTSIILLAILSYLDIPYKKWLKSNCLLLLSILIVMLIVFTVVLI